MPHSTATTSPRTPSGVPSTLFHVARSEWTVVSNTPHDPDLGYRVLAAFQGRARLFVITGGPPPRYEPPQFMEHEARIGPDELLRWRGQGGMGDRDDALIVARFDAPAPDVDHLDVEFKIDGVSVLRASLARQR